VNRAELRQLADDRILDAEALLAAGRWAAAYYLTGYAVECGLKACILGYIENRPDVFFGKKGFQARCWTHEIESLIRAADLEGQRDTDSAGNPILANNWLVVGNWNEGTRYEQATEDKARKLHGAITNDPDGVLPWIRARW
jgi:HEPN domain-containing protein